MAKQRMAPQPVDARGHEGDLRPVRRLRREHAQESLGDLRPARDARRGKVALHQQPQVVRQQHGGHRGQHRGAVILGLAETYGLAYAPTYSVVFTFVILIVVLAFRPRGIMGKAA